MPTIDDIKALLSDIFEKDLVTSLQTIISDWSESMHGYDTSTALGLLSMMTHILLEPLQTSEEECISILKLCFPIALSIMENDPASLKSRPYLRLLLAKSRFAETASRQAMDSMNNQLRSSQGVFYGPDIALLPIYVPIGDETPQWAPMDQPPELQDPVKLILRSAIDLGDLETEVLARRELIRLSNNPIEEFNILSTLQLSRQGDLNGYGLTLASKYLVSTTAAEKKELASEISQLFSMDPITTYWGPSYTWILSILLHKLERKPPEAIPQKLEKAFADYSNMEDSLLQEISRKMPELKDWVEQQNRKSSTKVKIKNATLRAGSSSRRGNRPVFAKRAKSPSTRRTEDQAPQQAEPGDAGDERGEESGGSSTRARVDSAKSPPERRFVHIRREEDPFPVPAVNNGEQRDTMGELRSRSRSRTTGNAREISVDSYYTSSDTDSGRYNGYRRNSSPPRSSIRRRSTLAGPTVVNTRRPPDNVALVAELKKKIEDEFSRRLEVAQETERRQLDEKKAILEELKKGT